MVNYFSIVYTTSYKKAKRPVLNSLAQPTLIQWESKPEKSALSREHTADQNPDAFQTAVL